jgi:hypothetical protein
MDAEPVKVPESDPVVPAGLPQAPDVVDSLERSASLYRFLARRASNPELVARLEASAVQARIHAKRIRSRQSKPSTPAQKDARDGTAPEQT